MSKLVIFDIDRTIYNGSIFLDFSLHLTQKNIVSPKFLSLIGFEFFTYQTGYESYDELVNDCLNYFYEEIKLLNPEDLKVEIKECLFKNHHKFYDYFFSTLKGYPDYEYFLVSLEPDFIVSEVANFAKIRNFTANQFLQENSFVQNLNLLFDKKELISKTKYKDIIPFAAFGDAESDLKIIKEAENKFIINATSKLQKEIEEEKLNFKIYTPENIFEDIKKVF